MGIDAIQAREAAHFLPVVNRLPVAIVEGAGSRVRDADGRELLDLTAGWGVCSIGHCHPDLVAAIRDQAGRLMQTTNLFYTLPQLALIERIAALSGEALARTFLVNSGTEAVDGVLKLAHRATGRIRFVSTENSFHGRTLGALQVIGQAKHRDPYKAMLRDQPVVPFGDLDAARAAVDGATAAFIVEPIQGEGGVNVAPPRLPRRPARDLPRARRAPDLRRDPDRDRPHRRLVRLAARGRRARRDDARQGPRRRLPAWRVRVHRAGREDGLARRPRRHVRREPARRRGRQRGAGGRRSRRPRRPLRRARRAPRRAARRVREGASRSRGRRTRPRPAAGPRPRRRRARRDALAPRHRRAACSSTSPRAASPASSRRSTSPRTSSGRPSTACSRSSEGTVRN